jgi:hypothetical protein
MRVLFGKSSKQERREDCPSSSQQKFLVVVFFLLENNVINNFNQFLVAEDRHLRQSVVKQSRMITSATSIYLGFIVVSKWVSWKLRRAKTVVDDEKLLTC